MTKTLNPLETLLYDPSVIETRQEDIKHPYERGIFITLNNHKCTDVTLYNSLKRVYQSICNCIQGENLSRDNIKVSTGKVPSRQTVMNAVIRKDLLLVAGIHNYDQYNNKTGRGSYANYGYQHLHLYLYGAHHYLDPKNPDIKLNYLKNNYLNRYIGKKFSKRVLTKKVLTKAIVIRPVGNGKYLYTDVVTPKTLHDYLMTPYQEPKKLCCINYIADSQDPQYPLTYLFRNT